MADRQGPSAGGGTGVRRFLPAPSLAGFLVLLAVLFAVAYAVGSAVGPVAPGMHRTDTDPHGDPGTTDTDSPDRGGHGHSMRFTGPVAVGAR